MVGLVMVPIMLQYFATFSDEKKRSYNSILLGFTPFLEESDLGAQQHFDLIDFVLNVYGKTLDNFVSAIGDNCNTNRKLATYLDCLFIGCANHRFSLAVGDYIDGHESETKAVIDSIHALMKKLRTLNLSAKLFAHAKLKGQLNNVTRWSSTFNMLQRFAEIRQYLPLVDDDTVQRMKLNNSQNDKLNTLLANLKELESVTKALKNDSTTLE